MGPDILENKLWMLTSTDLLARWRQHTPLVPALERQKQTDLLWVCDHLVYSEFQDCQDCVKRLSLKCESEAGVLKKKNDWTQWRRGLIISYTPSEPCHPMSQGRRPEKLSHGLAGHCWTENSTIKSTSKWWSSLVGLQNVTFQAKLLSLYLSCSTQWRLRFEGR